MKVKESRQKVRCFDQGEWSTLQLVDSPEYGRYFYHTGRGENLTLPTAVRVVSGGPVKVFGLIWSQHAPGTNVFD